MSSGSLVAICTPNSTPTTDETPIDERRPRPQVAVARLAPRPDGRRRHDREQRRCRRLHLTEPEGDEQRDEEDAAADAEQAGHDAGREAEHEREDDRRGRHPTISQTPTAARNIANATVRLRLDIRCWTAVPTTAPPTAGSPTRAA